MTLKLKGIWGKPGRERVLLVTLILSILMLGTTVYWFASQNKWLEEDYISQNELSKKNALFDDLFLHIQTAESAVRGYASTGNKRFVSNFRSTIDSIRINYQELKNFHGSKFSMRRHPPFIEFDRLIFQKIKFMEQVKDFCDAGNRDKAQDLLATERGIILTDSILKVNEITNETIRDTLRQSERIFTKINRRNNAVAYTGIAAAIFLIILVFYFLFKEIQHRKKISEQLALQKEYLRVTLYSIGEGLITTGNDGRIIYMNPAAERLTGWTNGEARNKPLQQIYNVVNEETGKPFEHVVKRILKERRAVELENNTLLHTKNSGTLIISNNGSPILDAKGHVLGTVLVFNDITEKKKVENKLRESQNQYKNLIENLPVAVYTCDKLGFINLYNKEVVKLWGKQPIPGKDKWYDSLTVFYPDGSLLPLDKSPMAIALKEGRTVHGTEILIQRKDGSFRNILPYPTPLFSADGQLTGAVSIQIDVTDKKEKERLIMKNEEKYKSLIDQASDAILIYSFDGTIYEFNNSICSLSGYSREEFSRLNLSDILIGDVIISQEKYDLLISGESVTLYRNFKRKDGSVAEMEIAAKVLLDGNVLAIGRDITERKRAEEKIRRAVERYDILAKATSDCIWDWDLKSDTIIYNDGIKKMFGYTHAEVSEGSLWWRSNIHPDDRKFVSDRLDDVFKKRAETSQVEYRYRSADNTYKHVLDRSYVIYDTAGIPIRMIGAMQDVTHEKEQERLIAKAIIDTQEKERQQIGMELHDNVNQLLTASLMYIRMSIKSSHEQAELVESLNNCAGYINSAIADIRKLSHQLTPVSLDNISLKEVIEILVKAVNESDQFVITLDIDEFDNGLVNRDIQTNLYRILQEQMNNIIKYAKASEVTISLKHHGKNVVLKIADNGVGFDQNSKKAGIGLQNIKRRTEIFAGLFKIISAEGKGCELTVELPL